MFRIATILLCVCIQISVLAQPTHDTVVIESAHERLSTDPEPITLAFDKDYSSAALQQLFTQQQSSCSFQTSALSTNELSTNEATEIVEGINQKTVSASPMMFSSSMSMIYNSACGNQRIAKGNFTVTVKFNGVRARYLGTQNIDKFNGLTMFGRPGLPLESTAQYVHQVCKTPHAGLICTYYHSGTIKATITLKGGEKGIDLDVVQSDGLPVTSRPFVIETCTKVPQGGIARCPPADMSLPHCQSGKILTKTLSKLP